MSQKILEEILWSYIKAEYEPSGDAMKFFALQNDKEISENGIWKQYYEFLEKFEKTGSTGNDPVEGDVPLIVG
jgi:hypothetical protein